MKTKTRKNVLPRKVRKPGKNQNDGRNGSGPAQPPRNSVAPMAETAKTLAYSARKNSANRMPLYSVWKPAASSDSASIRSNGVRLVSAMPEIRKMTKPMKPQGVKTNHQFGRSA